MMDFKASICCKTQDVTCHPNMKIMSINLVVDLIDIQTCDCIGIKTNSILFTGEI